MLDLATALTLDRPLAPASGVQLGLWLEAGSGCESAPVLEKLSATPSASESAGRLEQRWALMMLGRRWAWSLAIWSVFWSAPWSVPTYTPDGHTAPCSCGRASDSPSATRDGCR